MNKMKRIILAGSLAALASWATSSFADDNADSSSECTTYLGWSNSDFLSKVSSSQTTAEDVTTALTNCLHANDCTSISDSISDCDTLLGNRLYTASFYANKYALGSSTSTVSSASPAPAATHRSSSASSHFSLGSSNAPSNKTESNGNTSTSSNINW